jgi:SAM-dependent methyltransferase
VENYIDSDIKLSEEQIKDKIYKENIETAIILYPSIYVFEYTTLVKCKKIFIQILNKYFDKDKPLEVIDYGARNSPYKVLFKDYAKRFAKADINYNRGIFDDINYDIDYWTGRVIGCLDESFDLVLSIGTIEHVPDAIAYIKEAHRICKKDGYIIIEFLSNYPYHPCPKDYRRWTIDGIKHDIEGFFDIVEVFPLIGPFSNMLVMLCMYLSIFMSRVNNIQSKFLNRLFRTNRWGKYVDSKKRIKSQWLYIGFYFSKPFIFICNKFLIPLIENITFDSLKKTNSSSYFVFAKRHDIL